MSSLPPYTTKGQITFFFPIPMATSVLVVPKFSQFSTTKYCFIYFTTLLYKTFNISDFILAFNTIE